MKEARFRPLCRILSICLTAWMLTFPAYAESSSYTSTSINGHSTKYVSIDMSSDVRTEMMLANSSIISTQSVADMAASNGASAAVNGTHFEAFCWILALVTILRLNK